MRKRNRDAQLLRWYPPLWRSRYGAEFEALLEDTYGDAPVPWRDRLSIEKNGALERAREIGIVGTTANANARLLAGSQLVLCGWALFVVAGAIFAKFTEHWSGATPSNRRVLPGFSVATVQWAGIAGVLLVLGATAFVLPSIIRLIKKGGWQCVRRPVIREIVALSISIALTFGVALRARSMNYHQRNGGSVSFEAFVLFAGLAVIATIAVTISTSISLSRQIDFSRRVLKNLSLAAMALTALMITIAVGSGIWWTTEAFSAPKFLENSIGSGIVFASGSFPPALLLMAVLMVLGLMVALAGVTRVARGFSDNDPTSHAHR